MADMTDKAIDWLRYGKAVAPEKPVFLYRSRSSSISRRALRMRRITRPRSGETNSRDSLMPDGTRFVRLPTNAS
jgi:hypothetical protein